MTERPDQPEQQADPASTPTTPQPEQSTQAEQSAPVAETAPEPAPVAETAPEPAPVAATAPEPAVPAEADVELAAPVEPAPPSIPPAGTPAPPAPAASAVPPSPAGTPVPPPPAGAPVPPPAATSAPGTGISQVPAVWFEALRSVVASDHARTSRTVLTSGERTGNPHWLWLGAALLNGLLTGLALLVSLTKLSSVLGRFSTVGAGDYVGALLLPIVLTVAFAAGRAAVLMGVGAIGKRPISFPAAAGLASVSYIVMAPVLALTFLLSFIPGQFSSVLILLGLTFSVLVAEITLYTLVTQHASFERPPLLVYAGLTTVWFVLSLWISSAILSDTVGRGAFGGLL